MKPEDAAGQNQQHTARAIPLPPDAAVWKGAANTPVLATGSKLLEGVDLASSSGIKKLEVTFLTRPRTDAFSFIYLLFHR